ncbi:uncharacterized protein [Musca autumnalis]|uniref:uncharacterized protein n=1 Tax=Musca autumnalis TaxID=221902 RepID=UPI003CF84FBA
MVENRKLFYAISVLLLLSCCQIITMFPHNADSEMMLLAGSNGGGGGGGSENAKKNNTDIASSGVADTSNNSEYYRANVDSASNQSYGNNDDDSEFIIAVERMHHQQPVPKPIDEKGTNIASMGNQEVWEAPDSEATENIDDLIFLDKRPINQHQYIARLPPRLSPPPASAKEQHLFEIHHHLSADGLDNDSSCSSSASDEHSDSLTHSTFASSTASSTNDVHDVAANTDADAALPPHEIQLQPDNNEEVSGTLTTTTKSVAFTPLDLSDFLSLIPAAKVKAIAAHYYHNDPEVQRAHAFMSSRDFISLKQHIISIPEMSAFLRYLNSSGLDLVHLITTLTNLTTTVVSDPTEATEKGQMALNVGPSALETNDIEYGPTQKSITTTSTVESPTHPIQTPSSSSPSTDSTVTPQSTPVTSIATTTTDIETTTAKEQLNGLHGLVDSILDALPQDQILATFFDKLESSEQFSKLVDNIGSPEFSKILNNLQSSVPLRNLIFTLHNNGIYVIRIVDSLKSYFFLGGF